MMKRESMVKRIEYVDAARGIAILLVIAGHLVQIYHSPFNTSRVMWFICSFHMPLFFAISGYIGQTASKPLGGGKSYFKFLKKKAIALIVPLYVWTLIINPYFFTSTWSLPVPENLINPFIKNNTLWFLPTLFRIFVFYGLFLLFNNRFNRDNRIWKDLIVIVAILSFLAFNPIVWLKDDLPYSIHFYIGIMVAKHDILKRMFYDERVFIVSFLTFCVLVCHWNQLSSDRLMDILRLIIAPCAFLTVMNVCRKYEGTAISTQLSLFGRYTMEIYISHWSLLIWMKELSCNLNLYNLFWVFILANLISVPIGYICVMFSKIVETSPKLRLILFGRSK